VIFNTASKGYQEILNRPLVQRAGRRDDVPLIGNYGINDEDRRVAESLV